eukprot:8624177-Lingulodinium_polyedra.AAC.1
MASARRGTRWGSPAGSVGRLPGRPWAKLGTPVLQPPFAWSSSWAASRRARQPTWASLPATHPRWARTANCSTAQP